MGDSHDIGLEEAKAYYDNNKQIYDTPQNYTIQEILIRVPANANKKKKQVLREKAEKILAEINSKELPFNIIVRRYSDSAQAPNGGYRGGLTAKNTHVALWQTIINLKVNKVSPIVETAQGYHIIKLIRSNPAQEKAFAAVKTQILTMLRSRHLSSKVIALLNDLRRKAKIDNHLAKRYQTLLAQSLAKRSTAIGNIRPLSVTITPKNQAAKTP